MSITCSEKARFRIMIRGELLKARRIFESRDFVSSGLYHCDAHSLIAIHGGSLVKSVRLFPSVGQLRRYGSIWPTVASKCPMVNYVCARSRNPSFLSKLERCSMAVPHTEVLTFERTAPTMSFPLQFQRCSASQ